MSEEAILFGFKAHLRAIFVLLYQLNGVPAKIQLINSAKSILSQGTDLAWRMTTMETMKQHLANKTWQGETWHIS